MSFRLFRRAASGFTALAAISIILSACEAPHDNPFDPESPSYRPPRPPSRITDLTVDSVTSSSALMHWSAPEGAVEYCLFSGPLGWDGTIQVSITAYDGELPGMKPAGTRQQQQIVLTPGQTRIWALYSRSTAGLLSEPSNLITIAAPPLNHPAYISASARSLYKVSWIPWDLIDLEINAIVADADGIDTVWATTDSGSLGGLTPGREQSKWKARIEEKRLPGGNLEKLVGHPIWIHCRDGLGNIVQSNPVRVARVIYHEPLPGEPNSKMVVASRPTLSWFEYQADFYFTFSIDIVHLSPQGIETLAYHREGISLDTLTHLVETDLAPTVEDSLTTGDQFYYWTLSVVDEFGDMITSLEYTFEVDDGN